jgi:hypothetical protein
MEVITEVPTKPQIDIWIENMPDKIHVQTKGIAAVIAIVS